MLISKVIQTKLGDGHVISSGLNFSNGHMCTLIVTIFVFQSNLQVSGTYSIDSHQQQTGIVHKLMNE